MAPLLKAGAPAEAMLTFRGFSELKQTGVSVYPEFLEAPPPLGRSVDGGGMALNTGVKLRGLRQCYSITF